MSTNLSVRVNDLKERIARRQKEINTFMAELTYLKEQQMSMDDEFRIHYHDYNEYVRRFNCTADLFNMNIVQDRRPINYASRKSRRKRIRKPRNSTAREVVQPKTHKRTKKTTTTRRRREPSISESSSSSDSESSSSDSDTEINNIPDNRNIQIPAEIK